MQRFLLAILLLLASAAAADTVFYRYDSAGRLVVEVNGTMSTVYSYDEAGNLASVTAGTTAAALPVVTGISPGTLLAGVKTKVRIDGQNLLTAQAVSSVGGLIAAGSVSGTDTALQVDLMATSAGTDSLVVTTAYGNSVAVPVNIIAADLRLSPPQMAIPVGGSGIASASLFPSQTTALTVAIPSSNSNAVVTNPVTIPPGGSATFQVNGIREGEALLAESMEVFVESNTGKVLSGNSMPVSVAVDIPPPGTSTIVSNPASVTISALPPGQSTNVSTSVSVAIDIPPLGDSTSTSSRVSVAVDIPPPGDSTTVSRPVSTSISIH